MSCEHCLNRREFLAKSAIAAIGAAALAGVEGCGDGQIGPTATTPGLGSGETATIKVADLPGLASTGTLVRVPGRSIAAIRTGAATFAAFSTTCTHEGCDTDVRNNRFECPCHDSIFTNGGAVVRGPATRPLQSLPTRYDAASNTLTIG